MSHAMDGCQEASFAHLGVSRLFARVLMACNDVVKVLPTILATSFMIRVPPLFIRTKRLLFARLCPVSSHRTCKDFPGSPCRRTGTSAWGDITHSRVRDITNPQGRGRCTKHPLPPIITSPNNVHKATSHYLWRADVPQDLPLEGKHRGRSRLPSDNQRYPCLGALQKLP